MTSSEAINLIVEWGLVLIVGAVFVGFAISMIKDALKD